MATLRRRQRMCGFAIRKGVSSMADAKLRLQGTRQSSLLSGNITVTRFVIGSDLDLAAFNASAGGVTLPPNPDAPSNHVRLDIHVVSAPQLDFQNSYAKLAGDVDLRVRGTVAQPTVLGHISITEGNATFAGTKYELQHGDIYFSNPIRIDPTIDLTATAHVEDYDITIGLTGTASKPSPTFRSEPPLSEQDIFSLLALGRTQEEQQIYSNMQAQAGVNSTRGRAAGRRAECDGKQPNSKALWRRKCEDRSYVRNRIGQFDGAHYGRATGFKERDADVCHQRQLHCTAVDSGRGQPDAERFGAAVRDESGVFSLIFKLRRGYR